MGDRKPGNVVSERLRDFVREWSLTEAGNLSERVDRMLEPLLWSGAFGDSFVFEVTGHQYHLGAERDTRELADLASIDGSDRVLDVACFLGGPARQLVDERGCRVVGVDIDPDRIWVAAKITEKCGMSASTSFTAADAARLPFGDDTFTVVWSQCSLAQHWLQEIDRVLSRGGRLALTFDFRGEDATGEGTRWRLEETVDAVHALDYSVEHADDISERDVEIGWRELERRLSGREAEYLEAFGRDWVSAAYDEYRTESQAMLDGIWGNGRIVARKR